MGVNDHKISVTLDVGAEITRYKAAMSQIQTELSKLHIPDDLNTDIKNTFKNYSEQIKNLEQLIEKEGEELTPMNEKVIKENVANIEKTYKNLIKKLNSKGFQASVLEQDYKALELMEKAQDKYEKAVKDTNKQIKEQESIINKAKEALERQRRITEQNKVIEADRKKKADDFRKSTAEEVSELKKRQEVLKNTNKEQEAQQKYRTEHKDTLRGWSQSKARTQALEEDKKAQEELIRVSTRLQEIDKTQIDLDNELATATKDVEKAQTSLNKKEIETAATISMAEDKLKELENILNTLSKDTLKEIKQQLSESGINWSEYGIDPATLNSYEELKQALTKVVEAGGSRAVEVMKKISDASYQAGAAVKDAKGKIDTFGDSLDNLSERQKEIDRMSQSIVRFFSIGNAVQLFKRAVRSAVVTIKALDKVMTETAVVTDFTVADMWKQLPEYTARANKLGVTIHDVYESATLYYQQGLKTNEVMAVSNATLKMARIAGLDAAEATDRMTNALRGFNMEITETNAERVADVYSKLAAVSASNVDEISTAMTKVASLASNANMKFETTAAFLSQIIETTRESAETAGTALKTVVARFSEVKSLYTKGELLGTDEEGEAIDVNKVSKALRSAGIDLNEYLTGAKGLDDIFMELASKWDSLDRVQQRYIATIAAGSRQQSRFIAMMQDYKRTTELVTYANNAMGASNEQYEKTLDSLESKLNKLKNSWNTFLMDTTNSGAVKVAVDALTGLMNVINAISSVLPGFTSSILKMWAAFSIGKGIKSIFGKNGKAISTFMEFITEKGGKQLLTFPTILGKITGKISILGDKLGKTTFNIKEVGKSLISLVKNPIKDATKAFEDIGGSLAGLSKIAGIALALWALVEVFKAIKASSPEGKLQTLKKELSDATDVANTLNNTIEDLDNNFKSLDEAIKTMNSLKKSSAEWNENLLSVNKQVLDLIEKYPKLASQVKYTEEGLRFNNPDNILKEYRQQSARASLSAINAQINIRQASTRVARSQVASVFKNYGPGVEQLARSLVSGATSAEKISDSFSKLGIQIERDELTTLKNYGDTLVETDNITKSLNRAFIDTIITLNDWTPEQQKAARYINAEQFKSAGESKARLELKGSGESGINAEVIEKYYQDNIDPYARLNLLRSAIITSDGNKIPIDAAISRYIREKGSLYQEEAVEKLVPLVSKLPDKIQKLLLNPNLLVGGETFDSSEIQSQIELIDGLKTLLKEWGIDIEKQIELYNKQSPQGRDQNTIEKIQQNSNLSKEFLNNISNEAFKILAENADKYGHIFDSIFDLESDPQKFSDLVLQIFNEGIDLEDIESIEKLENKIKVLDDSLSDDSINNFISNLIDLVGAIIKIDPEKFANMQAFIARIGKENVFGQEDYNELIKTYGFTRNDFTPKGGDSYQLNIPQEVFKAQLEKIIEDLRIKYDTKGVGDSEDIAAYQRTAGYYASNYSGLGKTEEYYKGARSSFMNSEAGKNYVIDQGSLAASVKGNKELSNALTSSANAASKLLPKFKELTEVIKDNAEALQEDDLKAIAEVTKAFNKAFGTDLSEKFVKENKSILIDFANGVGDAYDRISDKVLQTFIDKDSTEQNLKDIYTFIQTIPWDINGQFILDDGPFLNTIKEILDVDGAAAEQLEAALKAAGITITWTTDYENIEIGWNEKGPIYEQVPKRHVATLTNGLQQQQTINARSGGSKSSGGGGSSKPKYWDNPYDELYNLLEKQNEALRTREKLEREYDRILKDRSRSAKELLQNSLDEITNLRKELGIQEQIQAGRVRMINELGSKGHRDSEGNLRSFDEWGASNYAHYDFERNVVVIDWAAIDRINDPDKGGAIEAYISKLEELSSSFEETQDKIEEMKDLIQEIRERGMKEYIDYEKRALDAIIAREQKVIDEYSALSDTINESNSNILSSLRESIDLERQIRDNTKTEQDIADKEARLAYLQRDTSGANQQEILKLQKELDQARESYGDTLVDQSIENLETENEKAQEQRQQQIDIMQAQLNWMEETGGFWEEVYSLFEGSFDENGKVIEDSKLMNLIRQAEGYRGMSKFGKQNFDNDLIVDTNQAYLGYTNWTGQGQGDDSAIIEETPVSENPYPSASGNLGGLNRYINFGDRSDAVRQLQAGLNDLVRDQMLGGETIDEDGSYGPATKQKVALLQSTLNEYFGSGLRVDGYWGPRTYEALMNTHLNRYKTGGLVTSTGPAWLDGTKSSPEMVLSARDTENFIALRNALTQMVAQGGGKSGDNYFDIQINVDELGSDYDVDQLADKVKRQIVQDSMYRNVNAINYLR